MTSNHVGRLIHTLKEVCPKCGKHLQLRARQQGYIEKGENKSREIEFVACSSCSYIQNTGKQKWKDRNRRRTKSTLEQRW